MTDLDPWRTLAKDGALRAELRTMVAPCPLIDYSGASWGEWDTLAQVAAACAMLAVP